MLASRQWVVGLLLALVYVIGLNILLWGPQHIIKKRSIVFDHTLAGELLLGLSLGHFLWSPTYDQRNLPGPVLSGLLIVSVLGIGSAAYFAIPKYAKGESVFHLIHHSLFAFLALLGATCGLMERRGFVMAGSASAMAAGVTILIIVLFLGHPGNDPVIERGHAFFIFFVSLMALGLVRLTLKPFALWSRLMLCFGGSMAGLVLLDIDAWRSPIWSWQGQLPDHMDNVMLLQLLVCTEAALLLCIYIVRLSILYKGQQSSGDVGPEVAVDDDGIELAHIVGRGADSD